MRLILLLDGNIHWKAASATNQTRKTDMPFNVKPLFRNSF
jgi:hypothetical protein